MKNENKQPKELLVEKVGSENAEKWTEIVKQMIKQEVKSKETVA